MNRETLPFDLGTDPAREPACPSDLVLDRFLAGELAGPERDEVVVHLDSCPDCADRRAAFERAAARFPEEVFVEGLAARTARTARTRGLHRIGTVGALAAAAAATAFFLVPRGGVAPGPAVRAKGGDRLEVYASRDGQVDRLLPGEALAPGDALRFEVGAAERAWVVVLGLDAAGAVTAYAGGEGGGVPLDPGATSLLPGSVVLDDTPGTERLVALFCERPLERDAAIRAGERALSRGDGDPARAPALGLPGCRETSLAFRKVER